MRSLWGAFPTVGGVDAVVDLVDVLDAVEQFRGVWTYRKGP